MGYFVVNIPILLPFCFDPHWILFALCKHNEEPFILYCSSLSDPPPESLVQNINGFLFHRAAVEAKGCEILDIETSKQTNSHDCGLYVLMYSDLLIEAVVTTVALSELFRVTLSWTRLKPMSEQPNSSESSPVSEKPTSCSSFLTERKLQIFRNTSPFFWKKSALSTLDIIILRSGRL